MVIVVFIVTMCYYNSFPNLPSFIAHHQRQDASSKVHMNLLMPVLTPVWHIEEMVVIASNKGGNPAGILNLEEDCQSLLSFQVFSSVNWSSSIGDSNY